MISAPTAREEPGAASPTFEQGLDPPATLGRAASQYDFVKVRVWLGHDQAHWYTFSRFLMSRTLTASRVPHDKATRIALAVKKDLVDRGRLDISRDELEAVLCAMLEKHGCGGAQTLARYRTVASFFHRRRALIVLVCGAPFVNTSCVAQQLAARLNLHNVLQTELLIEALGLEQMPGGGSAVSSFTARSRLIRRALSGDIDKCLREGKSMIVEGYYLDPSLYLNEFGKAAVLIDHQTLQPVLPTAYGMPAGLEDGEDGEKSQELGDGDRQTGNASSGSGPLFAPVVLWMHPESMVTATGECDRLGLDDVQRAEQLEVQSHLIRLKDLGIPLIKVDPCSVTDAVDALHSHILSCIEAAATVDSDDGS